MSNKIKVLFKAPLHDQSGYATVARNLLLALHKMDVFDLYAEPIVWMNSGNLPLPKEDSDIIMSLLQKQYVPEETVLCHFSVATEFFGERSPFKKTVGCTMIETDKTAPYWAQKCNTMDALFVPSPFVMSSFMQSNVVKPIRVIPFGVDFDLFNPVGEKLLPDLPTKFNFMYLGQWLRNGDRKNAIGALSSFYSAFKNYSDVGLIMKTHLESSGTVDKTHLDQIMNEMRRRFGFAENEGPKVYLVHGAIPTEDIAKLYRNANVFIFPTLGEAWGMPLLEAAATELPIITTGGSGSEMFLNPKHTIFLDYEWTELNGRLYWPGVYEPHQRVTIPDMGQCYRMMYKVYKRYDDAKERAVEQRKELIARDFTWKHSAEVFASAIKDLLE